MEAQPLFAKMPARGGHPQQRETNHQSRKESSQHTELEPGRPIQPKRDQQGPAHQWQPTHNGKKSQGLDGAVKLRKVDGVTGGSHVGGKVGLHLVEIPEHSLLGPVQPKCHEQQEGNHEKQPEPGRGAAQRPVGPLPAWSGQGQKHHHAHRHAQPGSPGLSKHDPHQGHDRSEHGQDRSRPGIIVERQGKTGEKDGGQPVAEKIRVAQQTRCPKPSGPHEFVQRMDRNHQGDDHEDPKQGQKFCLAVGNREHHAETQHDKGPVGQSPHEPGHGTQKRHPGHGGDCNGNRQGHRLQAQGCKQWLFSEKRLVPCQGGQDQPPAKQCRPEIEKRGAQGDIASNQVVRKA